MYDIEKKKNRAIKMGYQSYFVDGKKFTWNKKKDYLEDSTGNKITDPKD